MREFSVPPVVTIGDAANLTDAVWDNAETSPNSVQFARRTPSGWSDVTCRQFRDEVIAVARGLLAAGIEPGVRVGLMSHTRYEWTLFDYAIWAVGAVTVPIYETSSAEQLAWILSDSGAVACVVETKEDALLAEGVRDRIPGLQQVWQIDAGAVDTLVGQGELADANEIDVRRRAARADDL
ncbi:MAG TPA: AMP-binding protein, partial [Micromonosporaceae bacterium]|nr:AMP-binding protein [Micromonosporaceae bacterium]